MTGIFILSEKYSGLVFGNFDTFNFIANTYKVDNIKTFFNLSETSMISVKMLCIVPVVTDEKLGPTCVSSGMCHG